VSFTIFMQVFFNIIVLTLLFVLFARMKRPDKDDPRLSKGLQLLSSKIAVLEDLNDRTESQVQQMLTLLDQKSRELQAKITTAENQVQHIRQSMNQSLEVAQIFQDKIPHSEVIERQTSMKYIRAARMAHQGFTVDEIMSKVDLPRGEVDFISKVNREQLSFREEDLPAWAKEPVSEPGLAVAPTSNLQNNTLQSSHISSLFESGSHALSATSASDSSLLNSPSIAQPTAPPTAQPAAPISLTPEAAEIVEKLNKLKFEMKNLDLELATRQPAPISIPQPARPSSSDLLPIPPAPRLKEVDQLAELGKQFRQVTNSSSQAASPVQINSKPKPVIKRVDFPRI
jgi:hypothetical protein